MRDETGGTSIPHGWLLADDLAAIGAALGVKSRRIAGWRERGLIPHPTLLGHMGKRPIWAYPPDTDRRLRSIVRWRKTTRDLESIHAALWAEGFPVPINVVRRAILRVLDGYEEAMLDELARFAPPGTDAPAILADPDALRTALEGYANELARMRRRFPIKRHGEMKLSERERGMRYWLHLIFGLEGDPQDARYLERIFGVSRGRSGTGRGLITWPPEESFPQKTSITPSALREAVTQVSEDELMLVSAALQTFLFFPALLPGLIPGDSALWSFGATVSELFDGAPAQTIALLAATMITNVYRQDATDDVLAAHTEAIKPMNALKELVPHLNDSQKQQLAELLKNQRPNN